MDIRSCYYCDWPPKPVSPELQKIIDETRADIKKAFAPLKDRRFKLKRLECLQPEDLTREIWALYEVSQAAHKAMTNAVTAKIEKQKTKKGNAA